MLVYFNEFYGGLLITVIVVVVEFFFFFWLWLPQWWWWWLMVVFFGSFAVGCGCNGGGSILWVFGGLVCVFFFPSNGGGWLQGLVAMNVGSNRSYVASELWWMVGFFFFLMVASG